MEELLTVAVQIGGEIAKLVEDAQNTATQNTAQAKAALDAALRDLQTARVNMRSAIAAENAKVDGELAAQSGPAAATVAAVVPK